MILVKRICSADTYREVTKRYIYKTVQLQNGTKQNDTFQNGTLHSGITKRYVTKRFSVTKRYCTTVLLQNGTCHKTVHLNKIVRVRTVSYKTVQCIFVKYLKVHLHQRGPPTPKRYITPSRIYKEPYTYGAAPPAR
jgi:hypothetical protein